MTSNSSSDERGRNGREPGVRVTRRSVVRGTAVGLSGALVLAGSASADHQSSTSDGGPIQDIFNSASNGWTQWRSSFSGALSRMSANADTRSAKVAAEETATLWNNNSSVLTEYANAQLSKSRDKTAIDTIRVKWRKVTDGVTSEERRWIVADVDQENNEFLSTKMVAEAPDRTVDHWVHLKRLAADRSPDELETFIQEFAKPNKPVTDQYEGRLKGRYGPDVDTSLI